MCGCGCGWLWVAVGGCGLNSVLCCTCSIRQCENTACHRALWNRDVNAAINILNGLLRDFNGEDHPQTFCRAAAAAEADADADALPDDEVEESALAAP